MNNESLLRMDLNDGAVRPKAHNPGNRFFRRGRGFWLPPRAIRIYRDVAHAIRISVNEVSRTSGVLPRRAVSQTLRPWDQSPHANKLVCDGGVVLCLKMRFEPPAAEKKWRRW
jgi:hypothetical protein